MAIVVWQDTTHVLVHDVATPKATLKYSITNAMDDKTITANKSGIALFQPLVPANTTYRAPRLIDLDLIKVLNETADNANMTMVDDNRRKIAIGIET